MESWDDENFEPKPLTPAAIVPSNKWEGEDEDDDVKESWEDEDEEQQQKQQQEEAEPAPKSKKKTLQEKLAEKDRMKLEKQMKEQQQEEEEVSPEEKARRQKESDINLALETTFAGSNSSSIATGIDSLNPNTKEEFQDFLEALSSKILPLAKSAEFPAFAEDLIRNICVSLSSFDLKKIKTTIENLYQEKQKIEKGEKAKKSKGKGKAKLKMDNENQYSAYVDDYDEFDDFM